MPDATVSLCATPPARRHHAVLRTLSHAQATVWLEAHLLHTEAADLLQQLEVGAQEAAVAQLCQAAGCTLRALQQHISCADVTSHWAEVHTKCAATSVSPCLVYHVPETPEAGFWKAG